MFIEKNSTTTVMLVQNWIKDLVNTGMSYSRISTRLHLSPSTIQKIAAKHRLPRLKTIKALGTYYLKIFEHISLLNSSVETYYLKDSKKIMTRIFETKLLLKNLK